MKNYNSYLIRWANRSAFTLLAIVFPCFVLWGQDDKEKDEDEVLELSPFSVGSGGGFRFPKIRIGSRVGATVGGAQDVNFARDKAKYGGVPSSDSFTPEGLFSEHDLPLSGEAKDGYLLDVVGQSIRVNLEAHSESDILAQIGFTSGIDAQAWRPAPLNLIAVVDKSGSMNGEPLNLVRESLKQIVTQMGKGDRLSIVLYGSTTHIHLNPIEMVDKNRATVYDAIEQIVSHGSTNMESGLELGFRLARQSGTSFGGNTRVMLFTDEQPNVGRTDANSFIAMAREASKEGIGLTTIGVATHFGATLAEKISSVRGGNLFFFPDAMTMIDKFRKEFDTMVLELAYDLELNIRASDGLSITGLFGIPGEAVYWNKDGSLSMKVETIFASHNKGAIYFSLGEDRGLFGRSQSRIGEPVASISLKYRQADNQRLRESDFSIVLSDYKYADLGLKKGRYLVDQYTTLKKAILLSEEGCHVDAYESIRGLKQRLKERREFKFSKEVEFVSNIEVAMRKNARLDSKDAALLKQDEPFFLLGEWRIIRSPGSDYDNELLQFTESNTVQRYSSTPENPLHFVDESTYAVRSDRIHFKDWESSVKYQLDRTSLVLRGDDGEYQLEKTKPLGIGDRNGEAHFDKYSALISGLPPKNNSRNW